ncbi:hypothetical protein SDC9_197223 [bioreactor metagenome]|uniref:Uncharacterized protein n=1 Tax=bioreactor metagenome TaxID=1076179 RepID=A0A645IE46_9ZZZZ
MIQRTLYFLQQGFDAGSLACRYLYDRTAGHLREPLSVDADALLFQQVLHVQGKQKRSPQFGKLGGQVEAAFQVGGIDDVDDKVGLFIQDIAS